MTIISDYDEAMFYKLAHDKYPESKQFYLKNQTMELRLAHRRGESCHQEHFEVSNTIMVGAIQQKTDGSTDEFNSGMYTFILNGVKKYIIPGKFLMSTYIPLQRSILMPVGATFSVVYVQPIDRYAGKNFFSEICLHGYVAVPCET